MRERSGELIALRRKALGISPDDKTADIGTANFRFFDAPVVIYLCMDRTLTIWSAYDLGAFAQSVMLAAQEEGLDTAPAVMLTAYPDLIRAELGIPNSLAIVIGIALGYGDTSHPGNKFRSPRRDLSEFVHPVGF